MPFGYRFGFTNRRAATGSERRELARHDAGLAAQILFQNRQRIVDCAILDLSDAGARLRPNLIEGLPKFFELRLPSGEAFLCEIIRTQDDEIGVRFLR